MHDLRSLIREVLSEEIAAIRAEILGGPQVERVRVGSAAELTEFALSLLRRAEDQGFVAALREGRLRFTPDGPAPASAAAQPVTLVTTVPAATPEIRKSLVTERDIAGVPEGETRLRLTKRARLTPLAGDEARRRGIRIERTLA